MKKLRIEYDNNKEGVNYIDILNLSWKKIKENEVFALNVDFNTVKEKEMKRLARRVLRLKNKTVKNNLPIGIEGTFAKVYNFNESDKEKDFISAINAILKSNDIKRYIFIYDTVCFYLDSCFYGKNLCDFHNNKCGEKRNTNSTIGCCRHYKYKILGPIAGGFVQCEHLKNYRCSIKCLPCKLFTCDYLEKKGIKFRIKDIFLLDTFFNPLQKLALKMMVYKPEKEIIRILLRLR